MELPFKSQIPDSYYEMALQEASKFFHPSDELISIKIRPIESLYNETNLKFNNAYVYPGEYATILEYLKKHCGLISEDRVSRGKARQYDSHGSSFVFVEHETGPEIIANLAMLTASMTLAKSVFDLITTIIKTINESNEKKKEGKGESTRFYQAGAISIEKRTKKGTSIVRIEGLPLVNAEMTVQIVKELLKI